MSSLEGNSPFLTRSVRVIDSYICTWIHNPILASLVCLATLVSIQGTLFANAAGRNQLAYLHINDYLLDILHNLVNLLFIVRFSGCSKIVSHPALEWVLLILQNQACFVLLFCPEYSILYANIHVVVKGFMVWQILCPYLILMMTVVDNFFQKDNEDEKRPKKLRVQALLVDTNNNFLPIFIAHSFAWINFNFPFSQGAGAIFAYKCATFSLKFCLIYRFILYELVIVIHDVHNLSSYSELYLPVKIGNPVRSWGQVVSGWTKPILIASTLTLVALDVGFVAVSVVSNT